MHAGHDAVALCRFSYLDEGLAVGLVEWIIALGETHRNAEVSRANGGLVERDMRHARRARDVLREIPIADLLQMVKKAGELYARAELPLML